MTRRDEDDEPGRKSGPRSCCQRRLWSGPHAAAPRVLPHQIAPRVSSRRRDRVMSRVLDSPSRRNSASQCGCPLVRGWLRADPAKRHRGRRVRCVEAESPTLRAAAPGLAGLWAASQRPRPLSTPTIRQLAGSGEERAFGPRRRARARGDPDRRSRRRVVARGGGPTQDALLLACSESRRRKGAPTRAVAANCQRPREALEQATPSLTRSAITVL